ncbi:MAG: F0F1 ATP synthase subunit delta [Rhodospirillales bacterium]|nr:F0F1 ATP synthase subunit delta [Rhodospirillales bacterium]MCW8862292.1 F0F1 ATP synthase subunit delta [Rhodospirillales bacterium]MCW8951993.1 F0F1 ATP synthase subunit delta [Rhodospirillales bacterium]MCW8970364.1 F0F1 ATP synthase subunit delta [Rhodospirillales bacterium]MCW9003191.1 F0F1 ATP synthase subunit delta [Rhodospirillales bacterium]
MSTAASGATGLSGRYAKALFDLAEQEGVVDAVVADLRQIQSMLDESEDLVRLIRSPAISREDQGRAIAAVLERAKASTMTLRFVGVAARNRRLFALPQIIGAFLRIVAERRGEVSAEVVSASKMTAAQTKALDEALKKAVGGKVAIETKVDPSLLGGLVVRLGSRMVDSSLRTKLTQLKLAMKGAG